MQPSIREHLPREIKKNKIVIIYLMYNIWISLIKKEIIYVKYTFLKIIWKVSLFVLYKAPIY